MNRNDQQKKKQEIADAQREINKMMLDIEEVAIKNDIVQLEKRRLDLRIARAKLDQLKSVLAMLQKGP